MFFLTGVARYLFVPLAEAVVFAMLASYFLSRTLVPTMAKYLLKGHAPHEIGKKRHIFARIQIGFEQRFERLRNGYRVLLDSFLHQRKLFLLIFIGACVGSVLLLFPWLGEDFFPQVDAGQIKMHLRARTGTRIEETARLCDQIDQSIRRMIPADELGTIIDNIGVPYSGLNLSYSNSAPVGPADADILVTLKENHRPTQRVIQMMRRNLGSEFPGVAFYFLPVDIVSQILNFGLPAPIDVQVIGNNLLGNRAFAEKLMEKIRYVPGIVDLRIQQPFDAPRLNIDVDRVRAQQVGYTQRDVAGNLLVALSGSSQTAPTYWLDPKNGVSYNVAVQAPQYQVASLEDLQNIPITGAAGRAPQTIGNLAVVSRDAELGTVSHYNAQPVIDIYGGVDRTDLGSVSRPITRLVNQAKKDLPRGSQIIVRGQAETMRTSFQGLLAGLVFSIVLVYFLIVVNFQSWLDPFIMISALPAALAGIAWFLFMTRTTLSVPALMGTIMCMGVATANSILVVSFAREQMSEGRDAIAAALQAGSTRFRPVLMTALAMIIGMVPMALGLGDGGEQNAPLGRAVIGGLLFATVSTLFFVPTLFSLLHGRQRGSAELAPSNR
jgi:multidrug efflux pump subunit AcrB